MEDENEVLATELIGTFNPFGRDDVERIKAAARAFAANVYAQCPDGRRKSIALTHIESAAMFAVKSIFEG